MVLAFAVQFPKISYNAYTKILNHLRGWDGKPTGSLRDSRVAEIPIPRYYCPGFFVGKRGKNVLNCSRKIK